MNKFFTLIVVLLCVIVGNRAFAGDLKNETTETNAYLAPSEMTKASVAYFNPLQQGTYQDSTTLTREQQLAQLPGYKLPKKALFLSALLPGAGELYVKSYVKAATFFLLEVGTWTVYGIYQKKGLDKEDEFQRFADQHWDPEKWLSWRNNVPQEQRIGWTHDSSMVELINSGKKTQQYYEMIGKYAEFVVGWEDVPFDLSYNEYLDYRLNNCEIADGYMEMRAESNDLLGIARQATNYVIINHILSAIDAAWTAKRKNNRLLETSLRIEHIYYADHMQPVLSLKIRW